jgi:hypothetical protein
MNPPKEKVFNDTKDFISKFTNRPISKILDNFELQERPLKMDNPSLNFMTLSIRGYIKNYNPKKTILAKEVKQTGLTVLDLCNLVYNKINQ